MRVITATEREFARRLAEACLRDRITTTFGVVGAGRKGRVRVARIAPATPAEEVWEAYRRAR